MMVIRLFQENESLSISPEDLILYVFYIKKNCLYEKKIKLLFFLLKMSAEYFTIYGHIGQGSIFKTDLKNGSFSIP